MNARFVENARCPECGFEDALTSRDCPECRRAIGRRSGKSKGGLSLSGIMLLVAFFAAVFAAAKQNNAAGGFVFLWLAPGTFTTIVNLSKKRFEPGEATQVLMERIAMSLAAASFRLGPSPRQWQ